MEQNWTFGRKVALGFGLSVTILVVVGSVTFRTTDLLIENDRLVTQTHQVLETIVHLLSLMKDAETGQRGYLLTGVDAYLEPYQAAVSAVQPALSDLRRLTSDDPRQRRRVDAAAGFVDAKLAELKRTIDLRRASGLDAALKVVLTDEGKRAMDDLRKTLGEVTTDEHDVLEQRATAAEASAAGAKSTITLGVLLGLVLVAVAGYTITRSLTHQLSTAVSSIRSSAAELEAAAAQQAAGSREQSSAAAEVSTTIRELLSTSRQIAESAQRVARVADETAGGARAGDDTVQSAQEAIAGIRLQVDVVVGHMLELGKKSQQAGGILEIVNELAEQTNILAINATIEAAGAGDAGKRFSVVADEIRKLAERVGGSTKEIRALIDDIRAAVNATVMATEGGSKAVDTGASRFSGVTMAFKQILERAVTTTDAAREIEISTKQQATAVEQVNVAIANVAQATKETEASSTQALQTATQLTALSKDLLRLVQQHAAA
jgi:methyl-accepting chemotaxis protein